MQKFKPAEACRAPRAEARGSDPGYRMLKVRPASGADCVAVIVLRSEPMLLVNSAALGESLVSWATAAERSAAVEREVVRPRSGADFMRANTWIAAPGFSPGCPMAISR